MSSTLTFKLNGFLTIFYGGLVLPCTLLVASSFWLVYAIDRHLIILHDFNFMHTQFYNNSMHTAILIPVIFEMFIVQRNYVNRKSGLLLLNSVLAAYIATTILYKYIKGQYQYPILNKINIYRIIFIIIAEAFLGNVFYFIGECVHKFIWKAEKCEINAKR